LAAVFLKGMCTVHGNSAITATLMSEGYASEMYMKSVQAISMEECGAGLWAFVAVNGDVQIGWCRKTSDGWQVEDMGGKYLSQPFKDLAQAKQAGLTALAYLSGSGNPGW
jgi:hypothetical protein